jgi:L-lactate dehydrogenase complex protein LldG
MKNPGAREQILDRIKNSAFRQKSNKNGITGKAQEEPSPVFPVSDLHLPEQFQQELEKIQGHFHLVKNRDELLTLLKRFQDEYEWPFIFCRDKGLREILKDAGLEVSSDMQRFPETKATLTGCEWLIAETGGVLVHSGSTSGRKLHFFPEVHMVVASSNQLVRTLEEALVRLEEKYRDDLPSQITHIAGPSRTADIEKTLVMGAHGPKALHVFLTEYE